MSVSVYDEPRLRDVEYEDCDFKIVEGAIEVFNFNNRKPNIFSHPDNKRPQKDPMVYPIPECEETEASLQRLAKAAVAGYGGFVAVVDIAKATRYERSTDLALQRLQDLRKTDAFRLLFSLHYYEELNPPAHVSRLQDGIGKLAVPYMPIVTMECRAQPELPEDGTMPIDISTTF